ncbi:LysE family transporter [Candidatus Pseudothioglobus singularis]|jgi:L-lysine exporter family protein LysE/ArgO|nr:LysE family transporter [Candidatus Pseudothioglobus singularis]
MFSPFITGFFLGLSLIVAIGAQNAFVLRQGILRQHVFFIALFCSISDAFLIILGVTGVSYFFSNFLNEYSKIIFGLASLWLFIYGALRLQSAFKSNLVIITKNQETSSLANTISIISILTFANPHVYLDTMILIGSISQQYLDLNKVYFAFGACIASFVWFFGIAYGAKFLTPLMQKPQHWRVLDSLIALIMFLIAINLIYKSGWI